MNQLSDSRQSATFDLGAGCESSYALVIAWGSVDGEPFSWRRGDPPTGNPNHPIDMMLAKGTE